MSCDRSLSSTYRGEDDDLCPNNWPTVNAFQCITRTINVVIDKLDSGEANEESALSGNTVDLEFTTEDIDWTAVSKCSLILSEYYDVPYLKKVDGTKTEDKVFSFELTEEDTAKPGLFLLDIVLYDTDDKPLWVRHAFLEVESNSLSSLGNYPLTIAEVRLSLRDHCASANYLIDDVEYTNKEIFAAMRKCIDYWNEVPPNIRRYSYTNFPYRYNWMVGITGILLKQAGLHKLRNFLDYNAGGVAVNENSRWQAYKALGDQYWNEYVEWVAAKKLEININSSFAYISGY